jgi:hypothetical protein
MFVSPSPPSTAPICNVLGCTAMCRCIITFPCPRLSLSLLSTFVIRIIHPSYTFSHHTIPCHAPRLFHPQTYPTHQPAAKMRTESPSNDFFRRDAGAVDMRYLKQKKFEKNKVCHGSLPRQSRIHPTVSQTQPNKCITKLCTSTCSGRMINCLYLSVCMPQPKQTRQKTKGVVGVCVYAYQSHISKP